MKGEVFKLKAADAVFSFFYHIKITKNTVSAGIEEGASTMDVANCEEVALGLLANVH